jgi:hypothetical protein
MTRRRWSGRARLLALLAGAIALLVAVLLLALLVPADEELRNELTWTDNSANETNFHIERKAEPCWGPGAFAEIATVGPNVTRFKDRAVVEGGTYCYRVATSNSAGKSVFSNPASRTVPFFCAGCSIGLTSRGWSLSRWRQCLERCWLR